MALFRNTVIYLLLGFLPIAANFLLAPVYTAFLSPEQYAIVGIATLFQTFIYFFISLSLDGAFNRLFFKYQNDPKSNNLLLSSLLLSICVTTLIFWAVLYFVGDPLLRFLLKNEEFKFSNFGWWVLLTTSSNVLFTFFSGYYRNHEKVNSFAYISIAFFIVPVAATLFGLVFLKEGVSGVIIGRAIGSVSVCLVLLFLFFKKTGLNFSKRFFREAFHYSFPLIPYQLMFAAFSNIDRIILEQRFTPHDFGVYNFASLVTGVVLIFITALYNAINPKIYKSITTGNEDGYVRQLNYLILAVSIGFVCACIAVVVPLMRLVINTEYSDAYNYIGVLFLSYIPYAHYLVYSLPLFYHSKTKSFPFISFFSLVAGILFNLVLIPIAGLWAVCFSLHAIRFMQMGSCYYYLKRNKFHEVDYIKQGGAMQGTVWLISIYSFLLLLNFRFQLVPVDIINIVPIILYVAVLLLFYKKDLGKYFDISSARTIFTK